MVDSLWMRSEPFGWPHRKARLKQALSAEDAVQDIPEAKPLARKERVLVWIDKAESLDKATVDADLKNRVEKASREMIVGIDRVSGVVVHILSPSSYMPDIRPHAIPVQVSYVGEELAYELQRVRALQKTMKARANLSKARGGD